MMYEFDVDVWFLEKVMYDVSFSAWCYIISHPWFQRKRQRTDACQPAVAELQNLTIVDFAAKDEEIVMKCQFTRTMDFLFTEVKRGWQLTLSANQSWQIAFNWVFDCFILC